MAANPLKPVPVEKVFVPGGLPQYTYVSRTEAKLEPKLRRAAAHSTKLITVTGATKAGKTVLTRTVFPRDAAVWLDGGAFSNEESLWQEVLRQLDKFVEVSVETRESAASEDRAGIDAGVSIGSMFRIGANLGEAKTVESTSAVVRGRLDAIKPLAINALRNTDSPLIIDDFHYLDREIQGQIVRALKPLIFDGVTVIILAIPHRRFDTLRVEREMTARVEQIEVPAWSVDELMEISRVGFDTLNVSIEASEQRAFAEEAHGSPHLMQEFCLELCFRNAISETAYSLRHVDVGRKEREAVFRTVAASTGKTMFEKLSRGPRQRTDRKERELADGSKTDIYGLVLKALANMKPGIETIEYEALRASIRDTSRGGVLPGAHEVSRVLEHMAQIAADDEASTPVIDWEKDERRLHITDPFFAYYLRWGDTSV